MTGKKSRKLWLIPVVLLLVILAGGTVYLADNFDAEPAAKALLTEDLPGITVTREKGRIIFRPETVRGGLIFYPGGKVEAIAYAPLMADLAEEGILCALIEMPLRIGFLSINSADAVFAEFPDVSQWILAGHSLGGVSAALYAAGHTEKIDGMAFLASYSTKDLSGSGLRAVSLFGSEDKVLNMGGYNRAKANFPAGTEEIIIEGGNHARFGSYGLQPGDGTALISPEEQRRITVAAILELYQ